MTLDNVSKVSYNALMTGFTKLFSTIIHSTIWREDMHVKIIWITMLAMADRNGRVWASLPGLADAARVTIDQCQDALKRLSSPDEWSRTKTNAGRRIEEIDGGWQISNYLKYRQKRDEDERRLQTREAVRRHREKSKRITVSQGKPRKPRKAQAEADSEADNVVPIGTTLEALSPEGLRDLWNDAAKGTTLRECKALNKERRAAARARIKEYGREQVEEAVRRIAGSKFCRGENDRGWVANFDFLIRPATITKALEGAYDDRPKRGRGGMVMPTGDD